MKIYFAKINDLKDNRWDPNYWRNDLIVLIEQIEQLKFTIHSLSDVAMISAGQTGRRTFISTEEVQYLIIRNVLPTGLNINHKVRYVAENSFNDPARARIENGDILTVVSGKGSIEKVAIVQGLEKKASVSQDVARIRLEDEFPHFSTITFLQSKWGQAQILRNENGTGTTHLTLDDLKAIRIPELNKQFEDWCQEEWNDIHELHSIYIDTGNEKALEQAEKKRVKLISMFERKLAAFIR